MRDNSSEEALLKMAEALEIPFCEIKVCIRAKWPIGSELIAVSLR